jgi:mono/diheme cytochrome c family protein
MNPKPKSLAALGAVALTALALTGPPHPKNAAADASGSDAQVARGKYLVTMMGCNDCHTPWAMTERGPEPDMKRMLSGHPQDFVVDKAPDLGKGPWTGAIAATNTAWAGPWGVSFTANLTPDPETGLGKWTVETFIAAIRTGKHEGQGRPILPPMPWPMYKNATDEDLRAIFAFLRSIPPIKNRVPTPIEPAGATASDG